MNPDDIERELRASEGRLDLRPYGVDADAQVFSRFVSTSTLLKAAGLLQEASSLRAEGHVLDLSRVALNSYDASVTADFIRQCLLALGASFSFETVMSSADKIDVLCKAQAQGYRTYLC